LFLNCDAKVRFYFELANYFAVIFL
jgi:hypothetical protein